MKRKNIERTAKSGFLVVAMALWLTASFGWADDSKTGSASLSGFVYEDNLLTPVEDAVVKIRNLANGSEFQGSPTDKAGIFLIQGVAEGRYALGVKAKDGDYNFEFELFLKDGERGNVRLALKPGTSAVVAGRKSRKAPFFLTPLGIATAIGTAGAAGAVVYETVKPNPPSSSPSGK